MEFQIVPHDTNVCNETELVLCIADIKSKWKD